MSLARRGCFALFGRVIFLTLGVGAETSLVDAHQMGSELEEELRLQVPDIADVVVRTET